MAAYRYSPRYRSWYRPARGTIPRPVAIGAAVLLALGAADGVKHAGHHHHAVVASVPVPAGGGNAALGQQMAAQAGWTGGQWNCLDWLWTRESGWRLVWNTAGSGAFGIPQALPASKMASAGPDYMTNPATEIRWGLGYIRIRYVTPCGAWAHETSFGWY